MQEKLENDKVVTICNVAGTLRERRQTQRLARVAHAVPVRDGDTS
jgi:hypothetical protein